MKANWTRLIGHMVQQVLYSNAHYSYLFVIGAQEWPPTTEGRDLLLRARERRRESMMSADIRAQKVLLLIVALLFAALAGSVTPEVLIFLGPLRRSLTSPISSVRTIAHAEVVIFRVLCVIVSVSLIVAAIVWRRLLACSFVERINAHVPAETSRHRAVLKAPVNRSLIVMTCCIVAGMLYVGLGDRFFEPHQLNVIDREDGVIESAGALLLLLCSIVSAGLAVRFSGQRARVLVHWVFAFGFFVMFGEEISWGQRLFSIPVPEAISRVNVQQELNLHNLLGFQADHIFVVMMFAYGFALPLVARWRPFVRRLCDLLGIPVASLGLAIGFLMVSMIQEWTVYRILPAGGGLSPALIPELHELLSSVGFCLLMYESWLLAPSVRDARGHGASSS